MRDPSAVKALREREQVIPDDLLADLSPLGWEHINLTEDYLWKPIGGAKKRPLRQLRSPISAGEPNTYREILSVPTDLSLQRFNYVSLDIDFQDNSLTCPDYFRRSEDPASGAHLPGPGDSPDRSLFFMQTSV